MGVKHWVLHVAVEGGLARKAEQIAKAKGGRAKGITPKSPKLHQELASLFDDNAKASRKLDIRCTDTNATPNSVLLIDSRGDLYTEGYAHNGKVLLFSASTDKPNQIRSKWFHIERI